MQSKIFSANKTLNIAGRLIDLSVPKVMGILNVTPDSFYDGKRYSDEHSVLSQVEKMLAEGADFIDVGGYSTRPGAAEISVEEELGRVIPFIKLIKIKFPETVVSIDTFRAEVANQAIDNGAAMVNDVSGGQLDEKMFEAVAQRQVPYVLMHMLGTPKTMTQQTDYGNLVKEVIEHLQAKISELQRVGVKDIIVDPGFGFAKTIDQNFELLGGLEQLQILGKPVLVGLSRKSMIWKTLNVTPEEALNGTTVLNTMALQKGASLLRVHDVREAKEIIRLLNLNTSNP